MEDYKNNFKTESDRLERELIDGFTQEEINTFKRLTDVNSRMSVLKQYSDNLKEMDEDDLFKDAPTVLGVSITILHDWETELQEEYKKLLHEASVIVANKNIADSYVNMTNALKKKFDIYDVSSTHIVKAFLDERYGKDDDSTFKESMQEICSEAVNFFIKTIISGSMDSEFGVK